MRTELQGDEEYFLPEKWFLYGTAVEGEPGVVGYIYVVLYPGELLAGNYALIADDVADSWASGRGIKPRGAEAVVTMHELGHAIGIAVVRGFKEIYDPDTYSVMSTLNEDNAGFYDHWYYSAEYWETKNLEYYETV